MFAENLVYYLRRSGISASKLGIMLGKSKNTASRWVNDGSLPDEQTIIQIADVLNCKVSDLFADTEQYESRKTMDQLSELGRVQSTDIPTSQLTEIELKVISEIRKLPVSSQYIVLSEIAKMQEEM